LLDLTIGRVVFVLVVMCISPML